MARARARVSVRFDTGRLDEYARRLPTVGKEAAQEIAHSIRDVASQIAPKDTTSLSQSIYVSDGEDSDYSERAGAAEAVNDNVVILEEIRPEFAISLSGGPAATYTVVVGVAASHGIFQEYGTATMSPQPYFTPAIEPSRDAFQRDFERRLKELSP
jgi:HK97 gp10 family phage protein